MNKPRNYSLYIDALFIDALYNEVTFHRKLLLLRRRDRSLQRFRYEELAKFILLDRPTSIEVYLPTQVIK